MITTYLFIKDEQRLWAKSGHAFLAITTELAKGTERTKA